MHVMQSTLGMQWEIQSWTASLLTEHMIFYDIFAFVDFHSISIEWNNL